MSDEPTKKHPELFAFAVRETGEKPFFTKIGAVFAHSKGGGYTIDLDAHPVDRKIVLFPPREDATGAQTEPS